MEQPDNLSMKLTSHAGRLREHTAGKSKPRETVLLSMYTDTTALRLSLFSIHSVTY